MKTAKNTRNVPERIEFYHEIVVDSDYCTLA